MRLKDLATEIGVREAGGDLEVEVADVTHDSRECREGAVFVAIRGEKVDGREFIAEALGRGAVGVISDRIPDYVGTGAWIQVADTRAALAKAAAAVHGHPSHRLRLVGVTGTNGKTTTACLIDSIIRAAEPNSAMIGTVHYRIGNRVMNAQRTTPEASTVHRLLAAAVRAGCASAVMEVSSHSIEMSRANGLRFEVAVFTNLTPDHLDYHKTMENYFSAKAKLFDGTLGAPPGASVINTDDLYAAKLMEVARGRIVTYGMSDRAQINTRGYRLDAGGLEFIASTPAGEVEVSSRLVGRPHIYNLLAAIAVGLSLGFSLDQIARGLAECRGAPGRFERVTVDGVPADFAVIVDYAHTEDALRSVLRTAREIASGEGRVIAVFGCGGDRDRTKRAPMGRTAAELSDVTIVTSDNPRSEDPMAVIRDIESGLRGSGRPYIKAPDRREAIFRAVSEARPGDVVVIAGKGHETYQILRDRTIQFDDREVAREALVSAKT